MRRIIAILVLFVSMLFGDIDLQNASKEELMSIKGIGEKKAEQIIEYRKKSTISSVDDLRNIKGFGDSNINSIKKEIKDKDLSQKVVNTKDKTDLKESKTKEKSKK